MTFAEVTWVKLAGSNICIDIPLPDNISDGAIITIEASGMKVSSYFKDNFLRIDLDSFISNSRKTCSSMQASVKFSASSPEDKTIKTLKVNPESVTFDFALTLGIGGEDGPLVGGVQGKMAGSGANTLFEAILKR